MTSNVKYNKKHAFEVLQKQKPKLTVWPTKQQAIQTDQNTNT